MGEHVNDHFKKSVYYAACTSPFKDDFPVLVKCMRTDPATPHTRQEAGFLLWHHALEGDDVGGLVGAGLLSACLANLDAHETAPTDKACAAGILLALMADDPEIIESALRARSPAGHGCLDVLHAHLADESSMTRGYCARALLAAVKQAASQVLRAVVQDGDLPYLPTYLAVLGSPKDAVTVGAVLAFLTALLQERPDLGACVVDGGGVGALLGVLRHHRSEPCCAAAAGCLVRLLGVQGGPEALIAEEGVALLVDVLGPPPRSVLRAAASAPPQPPASASASAAGGGLSAEPSSASAGPSWKNATGGGGAGRRRSGEGHDARSGEGKAGGGGGGGGGARSAAKSARDRRVSQPDGGPGKLRFARESAAQGLGLTPLDVGAPTPTGGAPTNAGPDPAGPGRDGGGIEAPTPHSARRHPSASPTKYGFGRDSQAAPPPPPQRHIPSVQLPLIIPGFAYNHHHPPSNGGSNGNGNGRSSQATTSPAAVSVQPSTLTLPSVHSPSTSGLAAEPSSLSVASGGATSTHGGATSTHGGAASVHGGATSTHGGAASVHGGATSTHGHANGHAGTGSGGGGSANEPPLPPLPPSELAINRSALRWVVLPCLELTSQAAACLAILMQRPDCLADVDRRLAAHRLVALLRNALPLKGGAGGPGADGGKKKKSKKAKPLSLTPEQVAGLSRCLGALKLLSLTNTNRYRIAKLGAVAPLLLLYSEAPGFLLRTHAQTLLANVALLAENGQMLLDAKLPDEFLVANPMRLTHEERSMLRAEFPDEPALAA